MQIGYSAYRFARGESAGRICLELAVTVDDSWPARTTDPEASAISLLLRRLLGDVGVSLLPLLKIDSGERRIAVVRDFRV
jgi:hypothetical protein